MLGEAKALALLETALRLSEADQTEAMLTGHFSQLTRFADSVIHQSTSEEAAWLTVRAVFGDRIGIPSTNVLDEENPRAVVSRAAEIARFSAPNADFKSLPGPEPTRSVEAYSE